ncbi:hypothetical protein LJK88_05855 [Paenibacillus sp. P26]|nr:hypothetical protein LJK88_05855 [Paenibacillus sp. P26]UUZ90442.1 hypothetical protein LJK87_31645 [Paenibacillus sp. P25]
MGDWRNWRKYYPTILFLFVNDLLYNVLTYNYSMWKFNPVSFDKYIYSNHTLITLGINFINFPAIVLIYLGHYPERKILQLFYVLAWSLLNTMIEYTIWATIKGISYYHGWTIGWSFLINLMFYTSLRLHYLRPMAAWLFALGAIISLSLFFDLPVRSMK